MKKNFVIQADKRIEIPENGLRMKKICAWCGNLISDGTEPGSHGICPVCLRKEFEDIAIVLEGKL